MDCMLWIGDSITQYGAMLAHQGYLLALGDAYVRKRDVVCRGFSGYNTAMVASILPQILSPFTERTCFVSIFLGANDAVFPGGRQHVPLDAYQSHLARMIEQCQALRATDGTSPPTLFLITPPPVHEPLLAEFNRQKGKTVLIDRSNAHTEQYANVVRSFHHPAKGIYVIDLFAALLPHLADEKKVASFLHDGLHLGVEGNRVLSNLLLDQLRSIPSHRPDALPLYFPHHADFVLPT